MILALRIACLALVLRSRAALSPYVNFTVTVTPFDIGLDLNDQSDILGESDHFRCHDNNTLPSAAWGSYNGVTCSTSGVNRTFAVQYWGTWAAVEGNTNASGSVILWNGTADADKVEAGRIRSTADDKQLYELWRQDTDFRDLKLVAGTTQGGRVTISRARFGASLVSQAADFSSTGRQTVFAVKNNTLNPAWSFSGGFEASQPEDDLSFVSGADLSSNVTIDVPANTSYVIATGFWARGERSSFTGIFEPSVPTLSSYHNGPYFARPGILMQTPLDPDIKYMLTILPLYTSFNSLTFFSSLSPLPDGYIPMGQDHMEDLNYLTGLRDGDTGGGPSRDSSGDGSGTGRVIYGGDGGSIKQKLGPVIGGVSSEPFEIDHDGSTSSSEDTDKDLVQQTSKITPYLHNTGQPAPATSYTSGEADMKHQLFNQGGPAPQREMRETDGGPAMLPPEYNSAWGESHDGHEGSGARHGQYDGPATPQPGPSRALLPEKQGYHDDDSDEDLK